MRRGAKRPLWRGLAVVALAHAGLTGFSVAADPVRGRKKESRNHKGQVDGDLPADLFTGERGAHEERLEQLHRRDCHDGADHLHLEI